MNSGLREKIEKVLRDYLASQGYPNISNDQIINLLPQMWKKLQAEKITNILENQGFGYKNFVESAIGAKQHQEMRKQFEEHLRNMGIKF